MADQAHILFWHSGTISYLEAPKLFWSTKHIKGLTVNKVAVMLGRPQLA